LSSVNEGRSQPFPPVSFPYGLAGAALLIAALGCQLVAILALTWLAFNKNSGPVPLWILVLLVSFPLGAASVAIRRIGRRRAGTLASSRMPTEQRNRLLVAIAVMSVGSALGAGGFFFLAFTLEGPRRLAFGVATLFLGTAISEFGVMRTSVILQWQPLSLLGWSPRRPWVIYITYITLSLVLSGLSLATGLYWPDLIPTP
jgi:hypothetical protein